MQTAYGDDYPGKRTKILILGAGNAQIDLIRYCKRMGMEVLGCSYSDFDPGIPLLDHFEQINITDVPGVIAYAERESVDFIYSVGSDIAMPTAARAMDALEMPCLFPVWAADVACEKGRMRTLLGKSQWNTPYRCFRRQEEIDDWTLFPATIKPVDSQGQRGVSRVENAGEIPAAVEHALAFSRNGGMIIEKYINGPEVSVNLFLEKGEITFLIITDRESFSEYPGGIIHRHYIPSRFKGTETETAILALARDVARILHVTDGPMYFQIKIEDGKPRLIETSPRLDGCHLWRLIRSYCGADLLEMTVRSLLKKDRLQRADDSVTIGPGGQDGREDLKEKEPYTDDSQRHDQRAAAQEAAGKLPRMVLEFFCQAPGTVFRQSKYADLPASYIQMYYRDGEKVKAVNGYMEKCGYRIIREDELQ